MPSSNGYAELLAFPLFWRPFITEGHIKSAAGVRQFTCLIAPYVLVVAGIMGYNYARFGSYLDFGANYNLTVNDMTKRGMAVGRIAPALFAYFFQPPSASGVFPYLQAAPFDTTYLGQTVKEPTFGSIFASCPSGSSFAKSALQMRVRRTVAGVVGVLIASNIIVSGGCGSRVSSGLFRRFASCS
ncbi:MAG: hypothetical protein ACLTQI_02825 [Slackia sp.]